MNIFLNIFNSQHYKRNYFWLFASTPLPISAVAEESHIPANDYAYHFFIIFSQRFLFQESNLAFILLIFFLPPSLPPSIPPSPSSLSLSLLSLSLSPLSFPLSLSRLKSHIPVNKNDRPILLTVFSQRFLSQMAIQVVFARKLQVI